MGRNKKKQLNPADAYRKQQRKREIEKNKKHRNKVRETIMQTKDEGKLRAQLYEIDTMEAKGADAKKFKAKRKALIETLHKLQEYNTKKEAEAEEIAGTAITYTPPSSMPSTGGDTGMMGGMGGSMGGMHPCMMGGMGGSMGGMHPCAGLPPPGYPYGPSMMANFSSSTVLPAPPPSDDQDASLPDDDEGAPLPDEPPPPSFAPTLPQHLLQRSQAPTPPSMPPMLFGHGVPPGHGAPHSPPHIPQQPWSQSQHLPPSTQNQEPLPEEQEVKQTQAPRRGFVGVPTALKVKRANAPAPDALSKPQVRVDLAAAHLVSQAAQAQATETRQKASTTIDDDFCKYMEEMQKLGAI